MQKIVITYAARNFFLNIAERRDTSGTLAPAPPITRAITAPVLKPFSISAKPIGMSVSARIYIGTPITAAIGTTNGLSAPANPARNPSGTNP